jgi:uncharacterized protein YkwD
MAFHPVLKYASLLCIAISLSSCKQDGMDINEDVRAELLRQINALRESGCKCGDEVIAPVDPLEWNSALEEAATNHATDMYMHNYFSHQSLDGTSHIERVRRAGYEGDYVGEVIARRYYLTKDVIEGWKDSESHCRALMDSIYTEMGGAKKGGYWVVDLGGQSN